MNDLGNKVKYVLGVVGVTEDRVSKWLGVPCNCQERVEKLNRIGAWAQRFISGRTSELITAEHLEEILGQ